MQVYVFGNSDTAFDHQAITVAQNFHQQVIDSVLNEIEFIEIKPNADLPIPDDQPLVLMDVVAGISTVQLIDQVQIKQIRSTPRSTVHDFDLGFQLQYLHKLGKLKEFYLIGIPMDQAEIDYASIHSILRKLVAQDIHGS